MPPPDAPAQRHLLHVFSTFGTGGPQVRFATLANRWGPKYRHSIVAMDGDHSCAARLDPGLEVALLPFEAVKGRGLSPGNLWRGRKLLRRLRPDLLLTYNWGAIEWALANRIRPLCRHLHFEDGFGPDEAGGRQLPRRVGMRRLALGGRHMRVVVPSRLLERIALETWKLAPDRLFHIPNGVDCRRFAAAGEASIAGIAADGLVVGSVGALRPEKNFSRLLRAVAAIPPPLRPDVALIGDGSERAALEALAHTLGFDDKVHFAGRVERPEEWLTRFDVYAVSSDTEQMPIGLLEAMAAGLPVVATDVGDVREMVAAANRPFVVQSGDETGYAEALANLLSDGARRRSLGKANRERALAEYDEATMVTAYEQLLDA